MTRSELMALMTGGFATVAAGVMAVYVSILAGDNVALAVATARHLLTASLMSAPAAFVMAKIMIPETETPDTAGRINVALERETHNLVDAITHGASQGMKLAINVLAMLIAFIALIAVLDTALIALGKLSLVAPLVQRLGLEQLDLTGILGLVFSPVAWLIGADGADCRVFAGLLGKAMTTNELIAYGSLADIIKSGGMSEHSVLLATYSLCGFANISSIGIQIGGIGGPGTQSPRRPGASRAARDARRSDGVLDHRVYRRCPGALSMALAGPGGNRSDGRAGGADRYVGGAGAL